MHGTIRPGGKLSTRLSTTISTAATVRHDLSKVRTTEVLAHESIATRRWESTTETRPLLVSKHAREIRVPGLRELVGPARSIFLTVCVMG